MDANLVGVQGRIEAADVAKGVGIIAVVAGHIPALMHSSLGALIYSFHMPLFFLVSGLLQGTRASAVRRPIGQLIFMRVVPYVTFGVVAITTSFAIGYLRQKSGGLPALQEAVTSLLIGKPTYGLILWFFPCLLVVELLGAGLRRLPRSNVRWVLCLMGAGVGIALSPWNAGIPWCFDIALVALPFWLFGNQISGRFPELEKRIRPRHWVAAFLLFTTWIYIQIGVLGGPTVDMRTGTYGEVATFYYGAFAGIAAVLFASCLLRRNRLLSLIGQASFVIYPVHVIGIVVPVLFAARFLPGLDLASPGFNLFRILFALGGGLMVFAVAMKIPVLRFLFTGKVTWGFPPTALETSPDRAKSI